MSYNCSHCGVSREDVPSMVKCGDFFICDRCVRECVAVLEEVEAASCSSRALIPTPREIYDRLSEYVVGQEEAKRTLSVAVYNHYKRIEHGERSEVELQKSNVLILGPTGCGKTLLAQTLARTLNVPFAMGDATALTEAGYVGDDVETVLMRLIAAANGDVSRAERGIIYIDEIDKIAKKGENLSITRDVSGEGVQQSLLKIIEGGVINVPSSGNRKHPQAVMIEMDTSNILFIFGGAFPGLSQIIEARMGVNEGLGFTADVKGKDERKEGQILKDLAPQDLYSFGLIPEFVGRIPVITHVCDLDESDLLRVLMEPKDSILEQFAYLLQLDDVTLAFQEEALEKVVKLAIERGMGARGLRSILERTFRDIVFDIDDYRGQTLDFTADLILGERANSTPPLGLAS